MPKGQVRTNPGNVPLNEIVPGDGLPPGHPRLYADEPVPESVDFSDEQPAPKEDHIRRLKDMAFELRKLILHANETAMYAEKAAADLVKFQTETMPAMMEQAGLTKFMTDDGYTVEVKPDVRCSIPKEDLNRRRECFEWLEKNGHSAAVKELYEVDVRTLDPETRAVLARYLDETLGVSYQTKQDIHPSTLKALVKELLEGGTTLPASFSVHPFKRADMKAPKGMK